MAKETFDIHFEPYIPASQTLPEITPRAIILGILLAILLAASSTFVGLKIARTIAGSIPAALISMLLLRSFPKSNILENNMVQTIASAGEIVAAGVIYTLPALILLGFWQTFDYFQTMLIALIGGILGVMFSIPLRRSMIVKENLPYPEGLATGEVLIAGDSTKGVTKVLLQASIVSMLISFLQTGFKIVGEQIQYSAKIGASALSASLMFSPILTAAGYIVGLRGLLAFVVGGLFTWGIGIPLFVYLQGLPVEAKDLSSALVAIQKTHFQKIGVGVLIVGGLWSVISLFKQIANAFKASFAAMQTHKNAFAATRRTDRDLPFKYVLLGILCASIPLFFLFMHILKKAHFPLSGFSFLGMVLLVTLCALLISFIGAAVASYIVGIVGTTSLPVSGIAIASIVAFSSMLLFILGDTLHFSSNKAAAMNMAALVIAFVTIVAVTSAIGGDNMQDLKAGQLVGATPWKQQLMLIVGAIASALVIPVILQTTYMAYGIGNILPRPGMNPEYALPAPQANLMATLVQGFFIGNLTWSMIQLGGVLAVLAILVDEYLKRSQTGFRFPALLFALGIYLPLGYISAFFVGGLIHHLVLKKHKGENKSSETNTGILCASGLIAGEAILGAILTIPFAYYQTTDKFALGFTRLKPYENLLGATLYILLCVYLYKQGVKKKTT